MRRAVALAALMGSSLLAAPPPNGVTEVFNAKCDDVARVAVPLFQKRDWLKKELGPPWPRCERAAYCFDLSSEILHGSRGVILSGQAGRYMAGGKWYSFFSGPTLEGGAGNLRFFEQSGGKCGLVLQFAFGSTRPYGHEGFVSHTDDLGHYQSYFSYGGLVPGACLHSNGRLEREYLDAIRKSLAHRKP